MISQFVNEVSELSGRKLSQTDKSKLESDILTKFKINAFITSLILSAANIRKNPPVRASSPDQKPCEPDRHC